MSSASLQVIEALWRLLWGGEICSWLHMPHKHEQLQKEVASAKAQKGRNASGLCQAQMADDVIRHSAKEDSEAITTF